MAEYSEEELAKIYFVGTRAGIVAYHMALIESGEEDGLRLRGLKERAKKAIKDSAEEMVRDAVAGLRK